MAITLNGSAGVTTNSGAVYDGISRGTAVASTSGTSIDFTSIPSWAKRITIMFAGVSTSGTSNRLIQIGSTTFTTSGYSSYSMLTGLNTISAATSGVTAGFVMATNSAADVIGGSMVLVNVTGNTWASSHATSLVTTNACFGGGYIALGGTLDRVRITTVNGTDTFDAGTINILYE
jgi:hypothetical protein